MKDPYPNLKAPFSNLQSFSYGIITNPTTNPPLRELPYAIPLQQFINMTNYDYDYDYDFTKE